MDPLTIGKQIKSSSPGSYDDLSDEEVGTLYLRKYGGAVSGIQSGQIMVEDIPIEQRAGVSVGLQAVGFQGEGSKAEQLRKKEATGLRKEFDAKLEKSNFKELQVRKNLVNDPSTTDLSVLYSYIKLLDPTTAVREGEVNLAKVEESLGSNVARIWKRVQKGGALSPQVRQKYINDINGIYNERGKQVQQDVNTYKGYALNIGVDPQDVIGGVGEIELAEVQEPQRTGTRNLTGGVGLPGPQSFIQRLLGGELAEQREPLTGVQQASQALGPLGLLLSGRPDVFQERGSVAAQTLLLGSLLKGGLGGTIQKGKELGKKALNIRGTLKEKELAEAAKSTAKINPKSFIDKAKEYTEIDPEAKSILKKHLSSIEKVTNATELEKRLAVWKRAYTQAQRVAKTPRAGLFKTLYEEGLKKLSEAAPEAKKVRDLLRVSYEAPKAIQKGLTTAAKVGLGRLGFGL